MNVVVCDYFCCRMGCRTSKLCQYGPLQRQNSGKQNYNRLHEEKRLANEVKTKVLNNIQEIGMNGDGIELRNGGAAFYIPLDCDRNVTPRKCEKMPKMNRPNSRNYTKLCDFDANEKMIMAEISRNDALQDRVRCGQKYNKKLFDVKRRKMKMDEEKRMKTEKKMKIDFELYRMNQMIMEIEVFEKRQKDQNRRARVLAQASGEC